MLCVIAKLDAGATERLRGLQGAAAAFGLRPAPVYGHITLAAYTPEDDAGFAAGLPGDAGDVFSVHGGSHGHPVFKGHGNGL